MFDDFFDQIFDFLSDTPLLSKGPGPLGVQGALGRLGAHAPGSRAAAVVVGPLGAQGPQGAEGPFIIKGLIFF